MTRKRIPLTLPATAVAAALVLGACSEPSEPETEAAAGAPDATAAATSMPEDEAPMAANPFFAAWDTPFGIPPFGEIRDEHYPPAFDKGIEELEAEIAAIRGNPEPPTFENTVEALETAGELLERVMNTFGNITNTDTNDALRAMEIDFYPRLTRVTDGIYLDSTLFARVDAVWRQREALGLDQQQARLLELTHLDFVRAGAALDDAAKTRMADINARVSELNTQFAQNLLEETNGFELHVTDEADLSGLPASLVGSARKAAEAKGKEGWVFGLNRSTYEAFMTFADNRELRKVMFDGYRTRAESGEHGNQDLLAEIAALRAERAQLLGYANHSAYQLETRMAKTPEKAEAFLLEVWKPGLERARQEQAEMQEIVAEEGHDFLIEGWDWWYYAEKLRAKKYAIDEAAVKPYFEMANVRDGAFHVANQLFGLTFEPLTDVPVWNPVVQAYDVKDADGKHLGVFMLDYYARETKRGGAWMSTYRDASSVGGEEIRPIVTNNLNLMVPADGEPTLMSFDEVETLFHEFGHGLHGLMTKARYGRFSGTAGSPRDFTEFPAQFMEHYASDPRVLAVYAKHAETGEVIPQEMVDKILAASTHNQGFKTTEFIAASLLDLRWHNLTPNEAATVENAREFEKGVLAEYGNPEEIEPRYRSPYFAHIFAGGYSAGYYAYLWSEILDADGFTAFKEAGDIYDPALARRLRENVYEAGGVEDADVLYRKFRGQDPTIEPLLRIRGLDGG